MSKFPALQLTSDISYGLGLNLFFFEIVLVMLTLMVNVSKENWMKMENLSGFGIPVQMNLEVVSSVPKEIFGNLYQTAMSNPRKKYTAAFTKKYPKRR